ncbi:MAG: glycosyltransferase family 4 protein [Arhodomonas sp.]|nr:glycosyltransferase family 4 protein [Arhodomonas sp.]
MSQRICHCPVACRPSRPEGRHECRFPSHCGCRRRHGELPAGARLIALAPRLGFVDLPTSRGMHASPVARVGGIAVGPATLAGLVAGGAVPYRPDVLAIVAGATLIWATGIADDRWRLPARWRLAAQTLAVLVILPALPVALPGPAWPWWALALPGWLWCINLHNFMDGIDGIAGVQALTVFAGMAVVLAVQDGSVALPLLVAASAFAGFLVLNWSPARLFLGDGGSTLLGYLVGLGTTAAVLAAEAAAVAWFILSAVFFVDATVTLLTRIATGQSWHAPHRLHGYQSRAGSGAATPGLVPRWPR